MIGRISGMFILGVCSASALAAGTGYQPPFHPDQLKGPPAGRPNEVLVLGSPHLSGMPDTFAPAQLEPLLERLAAWKPEAIAVEAVSGLQCDYMRRNPARYADSVSSYCVDTGPAQAAPAWTYRPPTPRPSACWPSGPPPPVRRSADGWQRYGWPPVSATPRWCNGCACPPSNALPPTV